MRNLTLSTLLLASLSMQAQQAAYYKLSPFVREVATWRAQNYASAHSLATRKDANCRPSSVLRVTPMSLSALWCGALGEFRTFPPYRLHPLAPYRDLSLDGRVMRIETHRSCTVTMDTTRTIVNAIPAYEGRDLPQAFTGEGVVVGVQDIGFDLTHPTFYTRDMSRYRIQALWDHLSP